MLAKALLRLFFVVFVAGLAGLAVAEESPCIEGNLGTAACVEYMRKWAERGDAASQADWGVMLLIGKGVKQNTREALRWLHKSAEQGHAYGQAALGILYITGKGVVPDEREAYIWCLIATASGINDSEKAKKSGFDKVLEGILASVSSNMTFAEIKSARREASRRFEAIENRRNSTQDSSVERGGEFAIAKPPKENDVAAEVFESTWRSIVMIQDSEGQGSGVIIRPNMVATNCHVVEGNGIVVYKPENRRINENVPFSARITHRDEENDFCILEVKGLWGIAATIRKYDTLRVGENVYALGAPRGLDMSLSSGLISQLRAGDGLRYIQTDAAISPGSSGGGMFDKEGNFIGILTSKFVDESTEGIGFAIPADLVLEF